MKNLSFYWLLLLALFAAPSAMADKSTQTKPSASAINVIESLKVNSSSAFNMRHEWQGKPQLDEPVSLTMRWQFAPSQGFSLAFVESEDYDIKGLEPLYYTNEQGALLMSVNITPKRRGKIYLKFSAVSLDGSAQQSFALAMRLSQPVTGDHSTQSNDTAGKRVILPSSN